MRKTANIIKERIKALMKELRSKDYNDILSIQLIESEIEKLSRLLRFADKMA